MDKTLSSIKQKKQAITTELVEKLNLAKALVLTDYTGLTHKQLEELRKLLKKTEAEYIVTKNTLLKRAFVETKKTITATHLESATATLFAYADEVAPLKALVNFFKTAAMGKIKSGLLGKTEITSADVEKMAKLPSRDMLLAKLVGQLQAPLYGLHSALSWNLKQLVWTLDAVKIKKASSG